MRIKHTSLINFVERKDYIENNIDSIEKIKLDNVELSDECDEKISFLKKNFRRLVLSEKTAKNILTNYVCPKDIRFDVLRTLPNRCDSILVDDRVLIRYIKTDNKLIVCVDITLGHNDLFPNTGVSLSNELLVVNHFLIIDLLSESVKFDSTWDDSENVWKENLFSMFMLVVTYLELTDVTLNIVEGGKSYRLNKHSKVKNETHRNFTLVNTNWNVETITLKDISVRGHWRLQPYGEGRSRYKYVFINPYKKGIVKRLSQKELTS